MDLEEAFKNVLQPQDLEELEARVNCLLAEMEDLKTQVARRNDKFWVARQKINKATKVVRKIWEFIMQQDNVINKAKLFETNLMKLRPITKAKVTNVLVDYSAKMDRCRNTKTQENPK